MKNCIFLIKVIVIISCLFAACKKGDSGPVNYSGKWGRVIYAWNGNQQTDTVSIHHSNDSLLITDGHLIDEFGLIKSDTIHIIESNTSGLKYLLIESDTKFLSNIPVNKTIDTIEYNRIN
jgi:hypothetical protein